MTTPTRQAQNLWGRAVGRLNKKTTDVALDKEALPNVQLEVFDTKNTTLIPEDARILLVVRKGLIWQRFTCGTRGDVQTPEDVDRGGSALTLFGTDWKNAKWSIEFLEAEERGRKIAWTDGKRIDSEPGFPDGDGNSLLEIRLAGEDEECSRAWKLEIDVEGPTVVIHHSLPALKEAFKSNQVVRWMMSFEVLGAVLDRLIQEHLEHEIAETNDGWQGQWLRWMKDKRGIDSLPPVNYGEMVETVHACSSWKEKALDGLAVEAEQVHHLGPALNEWMEESA
jgi:hypothetical protein